MNVRVLAPGQLTTLQDRGRTGYRHLGVGLAGALDPWSHAVANLLVGNPTDTPVLEITLAGPRLRFDAAARIAICGAAIDASCDGHALPGWRPISLPAGSELRLGACRDGARAWLSVAGGFEVEPVLGSASTDLRGGFGGLDGRALRSGDVLRCADSGVHCDALQIARWWIDPWPDDDDAQPTIVHILPGHDALHPADALFAAPWTVGADSNRQGLRLQGSPLQLTGPASTVSEPVAPGTVQLPPGGKPIVLLADAQTHGGYPRIGHAIQADWPRLARLRAGDRLRLVPCTAVAARQMLRSQQQRLARISLAIAAVRAR